MNMFKTHKEYIYIILKQVLFNSFQAHPAMKSRVKKSGGADDERQL